MQINSSNSLLLKGELMKNYLDEIYTVKEFTRDNPSLAHNAQRAKDYLKECYPKASEDDFVIIEVEGYKCVACLKDNFAPYELANVIAPFDENIMYPRQELITKYAFKTY